ncbi:MAG: hypothetical protein AAF270_04710 [Pseudomonadota bacterium]
MSFRYSLPVMLILVVCASGASATEVASPFREHRSPPQEAIDACATAEASDACSFTGREGETVEGTCEAPEGKPLACRPADAQRGNRGGERS